MEVDGLPTRQPLTGKEDRVNYSWRNAEWRHLHTSADKHSSLQLIKTRVMANPCSHLDVAFPLQKIRRLMQWEAVLNAATWEPITFFINTLHDYSVLPAFLLPAGLI